MLRLGPLEDACAKIMLMVVIDNSLCAAVGGWGNAPES